MRNSSRVLVVLALGLLVVATPALGAIRYATPAASGTGTCATWGNACTLQTALTGAASGDEVWVRSGVHKPSTTGDRAATFSLKNGVGVYGGFNGTETLRSQRLPGTYVSVLSGDLGGNDTTDGNGIVLDWTNLVGADNSRSVVRAQSVNATAVLDGVTVTGGYNETPASSIGAGLYSYQANPTLNQVVFRGNRVTSAGGAIYFWEGSPTMTNSSVIGNAAQSGGGIYLRQAGTATFSNVLFQSNDTVDAGTAVPLGGGFSGDGTNVTFTDVQFIGNTAASGAGLRAGSPMTLTRVLFQGNVASSTAGGGGGIDAQGCPTLTDATFAYNTSAGHGGGMYCQGTGSTMTRVTFTGNSSRLGGGLEVYATTVVITNALFAGNAASDSVGGLLSWNSTLTLTNAVSRGNRSGTGPGGGIGIWTGSATLTGVTVAGNQNASTGGLHSTGTLSARNTIVAGNSGAEASVGGGSATYSYSLIEGGCPASATCDHAIYGDPLYETPVDPATAPTTAGDVSLRPSSPAIDAGDNAVSSPSLPAIDLAGNPRRADSPGVPDTGNGTAPIVDMGAYEFPGPAPDLTATKTNNAGGLAVPGTPFTWTITVANTGSVPAPFAAGNVVLRDDLPSTGAAYGTPTVTPTNVSGTVGCVVDASSTLLCTASGAVSLGAATGRLVVTVPVTPSVGGTLANPRSAGTCAVDPGNVVDESGEANNACSNSVAVGMLTPALTAEVHDAAHNVITSAPVGAAVHGRATVTGSGPMPTGTVVLGLYDNPACTGTPLTTDSQTLLPDGTAESATLTMVDPGFYYRVTYGGNGTYTSTTGACTLFLATQPGPGLVVNTLLDDTGDGLCTLSHCTLREAVTAANADPAANTVTFGVSGTISLASALPALAASGALTIDGTGQRVAVSGNGAVRIFSVASGSAVALRALTLMNGFAAAGSGGGIESAGALAVTDSTLSGNLAPRGGALGVVAGSASLVNVTFSGNRATAAGDIGGGGVAISGGTLALSHCTVAGNVSDSTNAAQGGGGLASGAGAVSLANTLVAGNASAAGHPDLSGGLVSAGNNVVGDGTGSTGLTNGLQGDVVGTAATPLNPRFAPLADNGGPTQTLALLPGSPAIDGVVFNAPNGCPAADQRGIARPQGTACDVGAFESRGFVAAATGGTPQSTVINTLFAASLSVSVTSPFSEPVAGGVVTFVAPVSGPSASLAGAPTAAMMLDASGAASVPATANGSAGAYVVSASASGAAPAVTFALTNLLVPTTLALGSAPNPSTYGQLVTFTATLSPSVTGASIGFLDGATSLGSAPTDAFGTATITISTLSAGTHPITVAFAGDATHAASASLPVSQVVLGRAVTVTADPKSKTFGTADPPLTYQVTTGSLVPGDQFTGALERDPGEDFGSYAILQGTLALPASYDLTYTGANLGITAAGSATTLTSAPASVAVGQTAHLVATVAAAPPAVGTPVGNVTFLDGTTVLCAAVPLDAAGQAACDVAATLPVGTHSLTASFVGSANWLTSSGAFALEVTGIAPTITSAAFATFVVDAAGTFTIQVTGIPTPTITITAGVLPTGLSFHDNGDGTATIAGNPAEGDVGTYALTISAQNGLGEATQPITVAVNRYAAIPLLHPTGLAFLALLLALAGASLLRRCTGA